MKDKIKELQKPKPAPYEVRTVEASASGMKGKINRLIIRKETHAPNGIKRNKTAKEAADRIPAAIV